MVTPQEIFNIAWRSNYKPGEPSIPSVDEKTAYPPFIRAADIAFIINANGSIEDVKSYIANLVNEITWFSHYNDLDFNNQYEQFLTEIEKIIEKQKFKKEFMEHLK